jgi:hypothetical protein
MVLGGTQYLIQQNWVNASGGYCALNANGLPHTLTVSVTGKQGGTGQVESYPGDPPFPLITTGETVSITYPAGTVVTLAYTAYVGYFTGWSQDCSGVQLCVVTMDSDKSVTGTFSNH